MGNPSPLLTKPFSLYLDAVRFLAAVLVVVDHFRQHGIVSGTLAEMLPGLGREAVIVFFVLSGFVIAYTTDQKTHTLGAYCAARCTRIYSVAIPVLLLAFLAGAIALLLGHHIDTLYEAGKPYQYIPFHLLFLGELWNLSEVPPWLTPYWSLSYEVWYYVFFGSVFYLKGVTRLVVGSAVFLILGHKLWLLLPVWMSGVYLYYWQKKNVIAPMIARAGWMLTILLLVAFELGHWAAYLKAVGLAAWPFRSLPLRSAERFLADYVVCAIVVSNFLCARFAGFGKLALFEKPIRLYSSYTFTLYLVHALVLNLWLAIYKQRASSLAEIAALAALIALATYVLGLLTEQRKHWFASFFAAMGRSVAFRPTDAWRRKA